MPHCLRSEFSAFLFALAWHTEWSLLLHDVTGDRMIPFVANAAATALAKIANAFEWPGQPPKLPLPLGISSPCRRRTEPWPLATCTETLVKIARVVPEICSLTDRQTDRQTHTHTDVLITIFRHRSRGRSNYQSWRQLTATLNDQLAMIRTIATWSEKFSAM